MIRFIICFILKNKKNTSWVSLRLQLVEEDHAFNTLYLRYNYIVA